MKIAKATQQYELWLGKQLKLNRVEIAEKHKAMAADVFSFLRATFYRWIQEWPRVCEDLTGAPKVLAIGDIHVENYGTWRDAEGRLIWGVNDFDEAWPLPYTNDLVRLAASAHLAIVHHNLETKAADACDALLAGFTGSLAAGGSVAVLAEKHDWLRRLATNELRDPVPYWQKMTAWPDVRTTPERVKRCLLRLMPKGCGKARIVHRVAGLGSLGRERYVALADFKGGLVAREAKALASSACVWAYGKGPRKVFYNKVLDTAVRCSDPFVREEDGWVFRRLAPDCSRIELSSLAKASDEARLMKAMGWELANIHMGTPGARAAIGKDLAKRRKRWLHRAAEAMVESIASDWQEWRKA